MGKGSYGESGKSVTLSLGRRTKFLPVALRSKMTSHYREGMNFNKLAHAGIDPGPTIRDPSDSASFTTEDSTAA